MTAISKEALIETPLQKRWFSDRRLGLRWQSAAATPLWMLGAGRSSNPIQSGVALSLPAAVQNLEHRKRIACLFLADGGCRSVTC